MPIHKNADGTYSWGSGKSHGSFESKAAAERQEAAIYANGWKGDSAEDSKWAAVGDSIDCIMSTISRIKKK